MTHQTPPDLAAQRRRLMVMIGLDALCVLAAAGALVGDWAFHIAWLIWVFVGAILLGFAAQIWLVAGLLIPRR